MGFKYGEELWWDNFVDAGEESFDIFVDTSVTVKLDTILEYMYI
jgi:hypothetical protein